MVFLYYIGLAGAPCRRPDMSSRGVAQWGLAVFLAIEKALILRGETLGRSSRRYSFLDHE